MAAERLAKLATGVSLVMVQVVAARLLWQRMQRPGHAVPFIFQEFLDDSRGHQAAAINVRLAEPVAAPVPGLSYESALAVVLEVVAGVIGPGVRSIPRLLYRVGCLSSCRHLLDMMNDSCVACMKATMCNSSQL